MRTSLLPATLIALATSFACGTAYGATNTVDLLPVYTSPERTLLFPSDRSMGFLHLDPRMPLAVEKSKGTEKRDWKMKHRRVSLQARGKIVIPKDVFVTFEASKEFFKTPKALEKLPADAFDAAELRMLSMDDAEDAMCDVGLAALSHLKGLRQLDVDKSEVSDDGLKKVAGLTNVEAISTFLTPVRGDFLKTNTAMKKLRILELESIGMHEDALQFLPQYPALVSLQLNHSHLTDKGIALIAKCSTIEDLGLNRNRNITDAGLLPLKNMKKLRQLHLYDTAITPEGLLGLRGMNLDSVTLPGKIYTPPVMAKLKAAFPKTNFSARWESGPMDADTKTIFSPMTR